jgi:hypothetical protein
MTPAEAEFPFVSRDPGRSDARLAPVLPITLAGTTALVVHGLLDTGAAVSVLPSSLGRQRGAVWEEQHTSISTSASIDIAGSVSSPTQGDQLNNSFPKAGNHSPP